MARSGSEGAGVGVRSAESMEVGGFLGGRFATNCFFFSKLKI